MAAPTVQVTEGVGKTVPTLAPENSQAANSPTVALPTDQYAALAATSTSALQTIGNSSLATIANNTNGAGATGVTMPAGGSGWLGWLSGIFNLLTGGTAGSPATNVMSIQGVASGTPIPISGTITASFGAFAPTGEASLTAGTTTSQVPLGSAGPTCIIINTGSVTAFINFGPNSSVTATTSNYPIFAGDAVAFSCGINTNVAAITASGSAVLNITTGTGLPSFGPGTSPSILNSILTAVQSPQLSAMTSWSWTPAVSSSPAYAANDMVGGLKTVATGLGANGYATITDVIINITSAQTAEIDLIIFSANPNSGGSTFTDNSPLAVAAADAPKIIAVVPALSFVAAGTPTTFFSSNIATVIQADASGNIYVAAVTRGTPTFSSTADVSIIIKAVR